MRKTFKYRLYPDKETEQRLLWILSRCRELYHAALCERRDAYHFHVRQHPNYYDLETRKRLTSELTVSYTSQVCSQCGRVKKKDLSQRWHECECGADLDRDVNAAQNVLSRGKAVLARTGPTSATA